MKLLTWLVIICGLGIANCGLAEGQITQDLKLKVRWTEKKAKEGKRVVTVFVKNEGMNDLKDVPAEIVLKGRGEKERQTEKVTLSVPRNQEKGFDVVIKEPDGFVAMGQSLETSPAPIKQIVGTDVVMGETVFASR